MSKVLESKSFVPKSSDLDQTLEHAEIKRLEDLGPTNLPG